MQCNKIHFPLRVSLSLQHMRRTFARIQMSFDYLPEFYICIYRAGEVVTFCWRLQRSENFAAEQESEILQYELRVEVSSESHSAGSLTTAL